MAKVTKKLQVTIPKALAQRYGIRAAGDDIEWSSTADGLKMTPMAACRGSLSIEQRLELFDAATKASLIAFYALPPNVAAHHVQVV